MEMKKQLLHVLSIGLMLSVAVPAHAYYGEGAVGRVKSKAQLYRKCIARACSAQEKQEIWADFKRGTKITAALLVAIAVIGGGAWIRGKGKKGVMVRDEAYDYAGLDLESVDAQLSNEQKIFLATFIWKVEWPSMYSDAKISNVLNVFGAGPEGNDQVMKAAAFMYYGTVPNGEQYDAFKQKFASDAN